MNKGDCAHAPAGLLDSAACARGNIAHAILLGLQGVHQTKDKKGEDRVSGLFEGHLYLLYRQTPQTHARAVAYVIPIMHLYAIY
jgi:hypothetical protein